MHVHCAGCTHLRRPFVRKKLPLRVILGPKWFPTVVCAKKSLSTLFSIAPSCVQLERHDKVIMSDIEGAPLALGKRAREDVDAISSNGVASSSTLLREMPPSDVDDSSDEEIGWSAHF